MSTSVTEAKVNRSNALTPKIRVDSILAKRMVLTYLTHPEAPGIIEPPEEKSYLSSLADAIFPFGAKERLMALLQAYFDESGTHEGGAQGPSPFVVVAGYVGLAEQWGKFQEEWMATLQKRGLHEFHMSEFIAGRGPFRRMDKLARFWLLLDLLFVIQNHSLIGIYCVISTDDFSDALDEFEPRPTPYTMCAWECIAHVKFWQKEQGHPGPVAFMFEDGSSRKGDILKGWQKAKRKVECRDDSFGFYPKHLLPLQAADITAWTLRRLFTDESDEPAEPTDPDESEETTYRRAVMSLLKYHLGNHTHEGYRWAGNSLSKVREMLIARRDRKAKE
jgi:hypothetical protein